MTDKAKQPAPQRRESDWERTVLEAARKVRKDQADRDKGLRDMPKLAADCVELVAAAQDRRQL